MSGSRLTAVQDFAAARARTVARHIAGRGVRDQHVLAAIGKVERELFVARGCESQAYEDRPLPIGAGQTISQPYVVALMIEALELKGGEKVLEIGAGSGYAAAVLSEMGCEVYAIERVGELAERAQSNLRRAGYKGVHVRHGDGTLGWPEATPFDAILVSAGAPAVPAALKAQLAPGGRLVLPVGGEPDAQTLVRVRRRSGEVFEEEDLGAVRFVPLIGKEGWPEGGAKGPVSP